MFIYLFIYFFVKWTFLVDFIIITIISIEVQFHSVSDVQHSYFRYRIYYIYIYTHTHDLFSHELKQLAMSSVLMSQQYMAETFDQSRGLGTPTLTEVKNTHYNFQLTLQTVVLYPKLQVTTDHIVLTVENSSIYNSCIYYFKNKLLQC